MIRSITKRCTKVTAMVGGGSNLTPGEISLAHLHSVNLFSGTVKGWRDSCAGEAGGDSESNKVAFIRFFEDWLQIYE